MPGISGRKTDVRDAEWIADRLRDGVLRASFIPDRPQRERRELTRSRTTLIQQRATQVNRLQKVLEGATIQLASVATDILGRSGRDMLEALVSGTSDAAALAQVARGRLREKIPQLEQALAGQFSAHQRFLIAEQLAHSDFLDASLERVSAEIGDRLRPCEPAVAQLQTIPGVGRRTAEVLVAEIGTARSRFPSAAHLASWAGPGRAGPGGVPVMTSAPANADGGAPARAARGGAPPWSRRRAPPRAPPAPT